MMAAKAKKQGSRKATKKKNAETSFVGTEITIWMPTIAIQERPREKSLFESASAKRSVEIE